MVDQGNGGFYSTARETDIEAKGDPRRKSSVVMPAKHRKSTVVVDNPDLVDLEGLSAADRALAEMGYVQVSCSCQTPEPFAC